MAYTDVFPADGTGVIPHIDPITQKLNSITVDGVKYWEITNYSVEEANDGSQIYVDMLTSIRNNKIEETEKAVTLATDSQDQQDLSDYIIALNACTAFPVGFTFPAEPACMQKYRFEIRRMSIP